MAAVGLTSLIPPNPAPQQKERRLLQNRRLDLDASKARLKKAKAAEAKATVGVLLGRSGRRLLVEARGVWHDLPPRRSLAGGHCSGQTTSGHAHLLPPPTEPC